MCKLHAEKSAAAALWRRPVIRVLRVRVPLPSPARRVTKCPAIHRTVTVSVQSRDGERRAGRRRPSGGGHRKGVAQPHERRTPRDHCNGRGTLRNAMQYRCVAATQQPIDFHGSAAGTTIIFCDAPGWHKHCYSKAIQGGASLTWEPGGDDLRPDKIQPVLLRREFCRQPINPRVPLFSACTQKKHPVRPEFVAAAKTLRPKQEN
jgi:hypothetical protein